MKNINEKIIGDYSKLDNNNDSDKFLNDDDIFLEDPENKKKNNFSNNKKTDSESSNSNYIEILDQDDKDKLLKENKHKKIPKNDDNIEVLNIGDFNNNGLKNLDINNNQKEKPSDIFEKSIQQYDKEVLENLEKKSNNNQIYVDKQNESFLNQLNHNEDHNKEEKLLSYNENGDLIIINKIMNSDDIEINQDQEDDIFEIDEFNINNNIKNYSLNGSSGSNKKYGFFKRSSMTVSDLTDDSKLRKSISKVNEQNENDYIEINDWGFNDPVTINRLEEDFKGFEKKFFTINKRADLYTLYEKIQNCNIYYQDPKVDFIPNIGHVSTLEYMIESTFGFDKNKSNEIIQHYMALDKQIFRWRSIIGDGNCYYRGVIYGFLEKIIFDKNIFLIKKLMIDLDNIMNPDNEMLKYLSLEIQTEIFLINKNLVLKIFYLFYEILDNPQNSDEVQTCYEFLIKCFNFCKHFDQTMTFYFRYILFDYIRKNKGKLYSKNFAINIGNLLPADYETSSGDFLYDRFFNENLMKSGTDAEKIVIYLTPFVLKTNIKIIIYEFDSPDSFLITKEFPCYLYDKPEIVVLYRKTHYDIAYEDKYFEKYTKQLSSFVNLDENLRVLTFDLLEKIRKSDNNNYIINQDLNSQKNYNIADNPNNNNYSDQNLNINSSNYNPIKEENIIVKCGNCNSSYIHKENIFGFCNICVKNELISNIMATYLIFSTEAVQLYINGKENHIPELLRSILTQKFVTVKNYNVTISKLASIAEMNLQTLIKDVKANICAFCQKNVNQEISVKLPCGCNLCDRTCAINCFKLFFNKEKDFKEDLYCLCGNTFNTNDFKILFELLSKLQMKDNLKFLQKYVVENLLKSCFFCLERTEYDFNLAIVKDPTMTRLYKVNEFKHAICNDCLLKNKIKEKSKVECLICNSTHEIKKIKKNIGDNDDNCSIL